MPNQEVEEQRGRLCKKSIEEIQILRDRLNKTYSQQKTYSANRRRHIEFEIGDHVYMKISLMKGVMRFGKKGILSHHYVVLYDVLQ